jgi:hypothetical protein
VSFDKPTERKELQQQIDEAKRLFARYPHQLNTLLIKPETEDQRYVQIKNVLAKVDDLNSFDIIGMTEDELGNSVLKRMVNIASVRLAMDDAGITTPIHVYGSLDPLTSVLYFLSGAEIFDGLTWLRFGYADGSACYRANYGVRMHKVLLNGDYSRFGINAETVHEAFDLLRTKLKRLE